MVRLEGLQPQSGGGVCHGKRPHPRDAARGGGRVREALPGPRRHLQGLPPRAAKCRARHGPPGG
eukprot:7275290-Pyramimonas_sp.AAC.4